MTIPSFKDKIFPVPNFARSYALSTGIPPSYLLKNPMNGSLVDFAAIMNLTVLFIVELIS